MDAECEVITRMLNGKLSLSDEFATAETGCETTVLVLAGALARFAHRMMLAGIAAAEGNMKTDDPEYQQMSIAAIDVGAACFGVLDAIRPDLLSGVDAEMLLVHLRDRRTLKAPPRGEFHDLATVLGVWTGDVAREIHDACEILLRTDAPDMALAAIERTIMSCIDVALLGSLPACAQR
jgi:hypothetical protein